MSYTQLEAHSIPKINFFIKYKYLIRSCFAGLLMPFGFAPFHFPGLAILGLAILFAELQNKSIKKSITTGFVFGLSFMIFGVSWIFVSINLYGNLNIYLSAFITIFFVIYLSIFYIINAVLYNFLQNNSTKILSAFIFSATWCLCEYLRANFASGFPWLIIGFGQIDSPLQYLLPYIGIYGVSFLTCLASCFLYIAIKQQKSSSVYENSSTASTKQESSSVEFTKRSNITYLLIFLIIILSPISLKNLNSNYKKSAAINVGVIQANLSMRDKWDEAIFEEILKRYKSGINNLKDQAKLIVLPESAIPVPQIYAKNFIKEIKKINKANATQILIGIPKEVNQEEFLYYNALSQFGNGKKSYLKQHLVPFGEYIPKPFNKITEYLGVPDAAMLPGPKNQSLLKYHNHPFASLICFEVAYPEILRSQLPKAQWIVSVSDAGWFGHSLAVYQLLQMSQALSLMTSRYQIVANNNGLSSIIDNKGKILNSLPAFSSMDLYGSIYPSSINTIWNTFGDKPSLYLCIMIIIIALIKKRSYPYRSTLQ